jgi:hypothetical protein
LDETASKKDLDVGLKSGWLIVDVVVLLFSVGEEESESISGSFVVVMGGGADFGIDTREKAEGVYIEVGS